MEKDFSYHIKEDGINEVIEENGNMIMMLREVAWQGRDYRLELRKWIVDTEKEKPMRGVSFMTEQGPHTLTETLIKHGYGNTLNVLRELSGREDFEDSLISTIGKAKVDETKLKEYTIDDDDYFIPNKENLGI